MTDINREIFEEFKKYLDEKFSVNEEGHKRIEAQTTKTNGRVTTLEANWNRLLGATVIINMFVVPILVWLVVNHLHAD